MKLPRVASVIEESTCNLGRRWFYWVLFLRKHPPNLFRAAMQPLPSLKHRISIIRAPNRPSAEIGDFGAS